MQLKQTHLPNPTQDLDQLYADLVKYGIALLANGLSTAEVATFTAELNTLAQSERQAGCAFLEDGNMGELGRGPNQRVFGLVAKSKKLRALATRTQALDTVRRMFGDTYSLPDAMIEEAGLNEALLSSLTANIVNTGGVEMMTHADQAFMPPTTPFPGVINVIWLLSDFVENNGATLVAPGTHTEPNPQQFFLQPPDVVPIQAPAGTAVFLDGRTWHRTGVNTTDESRLAIFAYYCRPFIRQQENFALSLTAADIQSMDNQLLKLLGFKVWFTLGGVDGSLNNTMVTPLN